MTNISLFGIIWHMNQYDMIQYVGLMESKLKHIKSLITHYCNTDYYSTYKMNSEFQTIVRKNDGFL